MTVNTKDGTALYDVAFSVVWVSGGDVEQRNEAVALANCTNCTSVSVAFQTIFILGRSDVAITPVNSSLAVNYGCRDCGTSAISVQLVASLTALPDPATMVRLNEIWRELDRLAGQIPDLSDRRIYDRLTALARRRSCRRSSRRAARSPRRRTLPAAAPGFPPTAAPRRRPRLPGRPTGRRPPTAPARPPEATGRCRAGGILDGHR